MSEGLTPFSKMTTIKTKLKLENCCFCFALDSAVIAIGVIGLVLSCVGLVWLPPVLQPTTIAFPLTLLAYPAVVSFVIYGLLIAGAVKKRPGFLVPWLVLSLASAVGATILSIETFVYNQHGSEDLRNIFLGAALISLPFFLYFWSVAFGLYRQLMKGHLPIANVQGE